MLSCDHRIGAIQEITRELWKSYIHAKKKKKRMKKKRIGSMKKRVEEYEKLLKQ